MNRWIGKIAVVTGASSGIGLAIAKSFVQHGLTVVGLARRKDKMEEEMRNFGAVNVKFHAVQCDISKDHEVAVAFDWIKEYVGKVQILINNAGISKSGKFTELDTVVLREIIDVNLMGSVYCAKAALKVMQDDKLEGHIVNMSSLAGYKVLKRANKDLNIYTASKHAVTAFSGSLERELIGQNIRVTNLSPGFVKTERTSAIYTGSHSDEPYLEIEDIVNAVLYVLSAPVRVQIRELRVSPLGETLL